PLVTLTATYNNSLTKGLNAPSAITSLTLCQVRLSNAGSFAKYFQKLLTSSTLRVRLISLKTARTCGVASAYSIGFGRLIFFSLTFLNRYPTLPRRRGRVGRREIDMTHAFSDQDIPVCAPPDPHPSKPKFEFPPLACDCHAHICGPQRVYKYIPQ